MYDISINEMYELYYNGTPGIVKKRQIGRTEIKFGISDYNNIGEIGIYILWIGEKGYIGSSKHIKHRLSHYNKFKDYIDKIDIYETETISQARKLESLLIRALKPELNNKNIHNRNEVLIFELWIIVNKENPTLKEIDRSIEIYRSTGILQNSENDKKACQLINNSNWKDEDKEYFKESIKYMREMFINRICLNCEKEIMGDDFNFCPFCGQKI